MWKNTADLHRERSRSNKVRAGSGRQWEVKDNDEKSVYLMGETQRLKKMRAPWMEAWTGKISYWGWRQYCFNLLKGSWGVTIFPFFLIHPKLQDTLGCNQNLHSRLKLYNQNPDTKQKMKHKETRNKHNPPENDMDAREEDHRRTTEENEITGERYRRERRRPPENESGGRERERDRRWMRPQAN